MAVVSRSLNSVYCSYCKLWTELVVVTGRPTCGDVLHTFHVRERQIGTYNRAVFVKCVSAVCRTVERYRRIVPQRFPSRFTFPQFFNANVNLQYETALCHCAMVSTTSF